MNVDLVSEYSNDLADQLHRLHLAALPNDIFPNLDRQYYRHAVARMIWHGPLAVAVEAGKIVGFCSVANEPEEFSDSLANEYRMLAKNLARFAITRPTLLLDIVGAAIGGAETIEPIDYVPEITVIAVAAHRRGRNIGPALIEKCATQIGTTHLIVKTSDQNAERFYLRNRFERIGKQNRFRRELTILRRKLKAPASLVA